jgi:hypothetical protein
MRPAARSRSSNFSSRAAVCGNTSSSLKQGTTIASWGMTR